MGNVGEIPQRAPPALGSQAAKHATETIPIVIVAADPVATGFVASLARQRGNITAAALRRRGPKGPCKELTRADRATLTLTSAVSKWIPTLVSHQETMELPRVKRYRRGGGRGQASEVFCYLSATIPPDIQKNDAHRC